MMQTAADSAGQVAESRAEVAGMTVEEFDQHCGTGGSGPIDEQLASRPSLHHPWRPQPPSRQAEAPAD